MIHDLFFFFFFNDTATTEIYTLSLHDALPISAAADRDDHRHLGTGHRGRRLLDPAPAGHAGQRSEEHTSELQSQSNLVCRLLLEKKKNKTTYSYSTTTHIRIHHVCSDCALIHT